MSLESREGAREEGSTQNYARIRRQPKDVYVPGSYCGTQREPKLVDENGCVAVVELVFGGRALIFPIEGDKEFRRVEIVHG